MNPILWTSFEVKRWILSLESKRYNKYINKFNYINGMLLRYITSSDLSHLISDEKDRETFEGHIRNLFPIENRRILYPYSSREEMLESLILPVVDIICKSD
jgi:hypothetical protein